MKRPVDGPADRARATVVNAFGKDVLLFRSRDAAERYLEPPDVRDGAYVDAVDEDGVVYRPVVEPGRGWFPVESVRLLPDRSRQQDPSLFCNALRRLLGRNGQAGDALAKKSAEELLGEATQYLKR